MAAWPPSLPSQAGRTAIVTGANTGIGLVTATELARAGARVHLACRSEERATAAIDAIRAEVPDADVAFLALDLSSFASIRAAAAAFLATGEPLHLLINNAGMVGRGRTKDGFEVTFGINHIGHFLWTSLLLDAVKAAAPSRVVTVASTAHKRVKHLDLDDVIVRAPTGKSAFAEYARSKLANILFSAELGRRLQGTGVTTYSLHPGVIASDIWRGLPGPIEWVIKLFMGSVQDGARTTLHCATSEEAGAETGLYYDGCKPKAPTKVGQDEALAKTLWSASEAWIGQS